MSSAVSNPIGGVMPDPVSHRTALRWRGDAMSPSDRMVPEETAIALSYNRVGYAVMMASPCDLEHFGLGFSLTERLIEQPAEIEELALVPVPAGIEVRMWIAPHRMDALLRRRRTLAGPTGCGLCGLEALDQAMREPPLVPKGHPFTAALVREAMASLGPAQLLNHRTRAMHAAGFYVPGHGLVALQEDVGRHNALDKLAGALATAAQDPGTGMVVMTSRVSVELIQKTAVIGASVLLAVSAPTALAIRVAEAAGITIVGIARDDGFEVFSHAWRIVQ